MKPVPVRDKYPNAVIEEPNLRLPKAMLKPDSDPNDDLTYMHLFEDDGRKAQHLAEAVAAGATVVRKAYRIRNNELAKFVQKNFKGMHAIHKASKATIGVLTDIESNRHSHSYLDLSGTEEQVNAAEELILDNILKTYSTLAYPVILMPPTIYGDYIIIPRHKISSVIGVTRTNLRRMEMESGAWIKIEPGTPTGRSDREILIRVFGPRENVIKGINSIRTATYDLSDPSAAQEELWREYNEPHWQEYFNRNDEEEAKLKEVSGEPEKEKPAEEGGSSQPQAEKQEEDVKEANSKKKSKKRNKKRGGKGAKQTQESKTDEELSGESEKGQKKAEEGGSGVTEKEKQPEHVHEAI